MSKVIRFEIAATDLVRSKKFYEDIFGWKFDKWDKPDSSGNEYYDIKTGEDRKEMPGIDGGLMKATMPMSMDSKSGFVCSIDVDNLDEALKKIEKMGGKTIKPKTAGNDGWGWFAYAEDPDGNVFSLLEFKEGKKM